EVAERVGLFDGFDAFGDGVEPEALAELDDGARDSRRLGAGGDTVDELLVDLEDVEREVSEVAQRRVAGTEVIDGESDTELLELREACGAQGEVFDHDLLGQFDHELGGIETGPGERGGDGVNHGRLQDLDR